MCCHLVPYSEGSGEMVTAMHSEHVHKHNKLHENTHTHTQIMFTYAVMIVVYFFLQENHHLPNNQIFHLFVKTTSV